MKTSFIASSIVIVCTFFTLSCIKQNGTMPSKQTVLELPNTLENYNAINPVVSNEKATLGRVLFYEKRMSANNSVSCGTCHKQSAGFADDKATSIGLNDKHTDRNSIAIQNLILTSANALPFLQIVQPMFWDGRENDLVQLMLRPVGNHIEMGITDMNTIVTKLNKVAYYKSLVQNAYGTDQLDLHIISDAMANFCSSIRSNESKFDQAILNKSAPNHLINAKEKLGFDLFTSVKYNCSSCHSSIFNGANVTHGGGMYGGGIFDSTSNFGANIGLPSTDKGIGVISNFPKDNQSFRIPDLHNVGITAPYMHDGSLATLDQVLDHYSAHIINNNNLDKRLKNEDGSAKKLNITSTDKEAMVAFLHSLTDTRVFNPMYSDPFKTK